MVITTILGVIGTFTGTIPIPDSTAPAAAAMAGSFVHGAVVFGAIISFVFIFLYWKGFSWMRWVVMVYCLFPIISVFSIKKTWGMSPISGASVIINVVLALFLLYYLNTPPVKAWFDGPKLDA